MGDDADSNSSSKPICSICYEDLKPTVEDLQSIAVCGHVFHELCLQQWFEYSARTKRYTCPVCKQNCKEKDAGRLYFQSVGDAAADPSAGQRRSDKCEEDPAVLRREVKRLENVAVGLRSGLELQGKEVKEELFLCKEEAKKEGKLKNDALQQLVSLPFSSNTGTCKDTAQTPAVDIADVVILDDIEQVQPMFKIRKESRNAQPVSQPGYICFSGGLRGPDGTNRFLGKWCKRGLNKGLETRQPSCSSSGDLIAVGADGRGGSIKVLRSLNQSTVDSKENSPAAKRCKYGSKTNSALSKGCLQIEHFFGIVGN